MKRAVSLRWVIGAAVAVSLGLVVVWISSNLLDRRAAPTADSGSHRASTVGLTGLDLTFLDGRRYEVRMHADRLEYKARRFGPLTLNPVKEVEMHGVRLALDVSSYRAARTSQLPDPQPDGRDDAGLFLEDAVATIRQSFINLLSAQHIGLVTRVVVMDIDIEMRRGDEILTQLRAARLIVDPAGRNLAFAGNLNLRSPAGDRLQAVEARWDPQLKAIVVAGPYVLRRGTESRSGTSGVVRIGERGEIVVD